MKVKVSEATEIQLDWMVSVITNPEWEHEDRLSNMHDIGNGEWEMYSPSTNWSQGGPIIEREFIDVEVTPMGASAPPPEKLDLWRAWKHNDEANAAMECGPTPLIAAMRCYVASKLGDEVDVPGELK
jgi:hypothetical protein